MMYQTEIVQQQQPSQKIGQTTKMTVEQHMPRRFPVAPVMEQEPISWEKKVEKEQLMKQIKDLVGQVQGMFVGQEEQQCVKTEQQELLKQLRDIQCQIQDLTLGQQQQQTIRKMTDLPSRIQDMIMFEQKKQTPYFKEHTNCQYETTPVELLGEKCEKQWGKQVVAEKKRQMIEKLIQQTRVLEQMLVEKQYESIYQMPKMEQLHFDLERELFEQIKRRFSELEEQVFVHGFEQEFEQKQRKLFVLLKKQIKLIEEIITPITGFEIRMTLKNKEQVHKEQCQQMLEKVRIFKSLLQEVVYMTYPETCEQKQEQFETIFPVEPLTKFYNLISLPMFYDEEEIFGRQQTKQQLQQETERISMLKKELEEIKSTKQELEMKLYETDKKVEQFKRQIDLLEKFPKYEQQQQQQQIRSEFIQCTKPEEELIKICLKPTIGQQQTYTTEPKTEMIKSRGLIGKFGEQHPIQKQQQQQQPITKYF